MAAVAGLILKHENMNATEREQGQAAEVAKQAVGEWIHFKNPLFRGPNEHAAAPSSVERSRGQRGQSNEKDQRKSVDRARAEFQGQDAQPAHRPTHQEPERSLLRFFGDDVPHDKGEVDAAQQENSPADDEETEREHRPIIGEIEASRFNEPLKVASRRWGIENPHQSCFEPEKGAEADIGSLAGRHFDQLAPELTEKKDHALTFR
jgi:hypothetical protein